MTTPQNKTENAIRPSANQDDLVALALELDRGSSDLNTASGSFKLIDDELQELARVQDALEILNGVKSDLDVLRGDANTEKIGLHETSRDEKSPKVERSKQISIPDQIGRFRIESLLGQGGYAKVFLGHDPVLNRNVAIKVLKSSQIFSSESSARFEREARAAAVLSHPNIIPVFETGTVGADKFIVSEYCCGVDLENWFQQQNGVVASETAATIVATIADAAAHAHQRGVIHRDLKLANVMLEQGADEKPVSAISSNQIRVTDFGLAKSIQALQEKMVSNSDQASNTPHEQILQTNEGAIVGTPAYMSPEQASGFKNVTPATDIYSMGVILYQLLTGELPIVRDSHIGTLIAVKTVEPKSVRSVKPTVSHDLQAICMKCLAKAPPARYSSAFDLAEDLNNWLDGRPVKARNVSAVERIGKWCARNPLLATALVAMTAGLILAVVQWRNAVGQTALAERQAALAEKQTARADRHVAMSQNVIDAMASQVALDPDLPPELRLSMAQRAVDLQVMLRDEEPDDVNIALQTTRAYIRISQVYKDLYRHEDALKALDDASVIVQLNRDKPEFSETEIALRSRRAGIFRLLRRADESKKEIKQMVENEHADDMTVAQSHFQSGMLNLQQKRYDEAIAEYEQAEVLYWNSEDHAAKVARSRVVLFIGVAAHLKEDFDVSEIRTQEALRLLLGLKGSVHSGSTRILVDLGRARMQLAQISMARLREIELPVDPDLPLLELCRQRFDEAFEAFSEVITKDPTVAAPYGMSAMAYELRIRLEVDQNSDDLGQAVLNDFETLYDSIEPSIGFRRTVGRILVESRIKIAKALIARDEIESALMQLNESRALLDALVEEYPGIEKIENLSSECDLLLKQHSG